MSTTNFGPVFARRGPYEYPCELTLCDAGAQASFSGTAEFLPWSKTFEWEAISEVVVDATPTSALLTIDGYRFRFPQHSITQIHAIIDPRRPSIGSNCPPSDPPPPPLSSDLTVDSTAGGWAEIWYSDWIAEDHPDLVLQSMDWLAEMPGVKLVEQEDHCVIVVSGCVEPGLYDDLKAWWVERVDGFDQTCDWPVPEP